MGNGGGNDEEPHLPAAESFEEQVGTLTTRLDQVEAEKRELQDRVLRGAAELDNYKKRMRREQADLLRYAAEPLISDLLPVVDNLERALEHTAAGSGDALSQGVSMVLTSLLDVLRKHGVTMIEPRVGDAFDPNQHEAVDRRETDGESNRVAGLWQRGYQLHDRLLRPARVSVTVPRSGLAI